mmetsp:Transcript_74157/g.217618  ORF Transcript_74157/g.217618 Transcript_74157/m.217618 type:complete len:234 (-) Transcript_74157:3-704(-)
MALARASTSCLSPGSNSVSRPPKSSSSSRSPPPPPPWSAWFSSRCASLTCERLFSSRLLMAARLWVDMRSKCLMRSRTLPAEMPKEGVPTEAPNSWMPTARPEPTSRTSTRRLAPAPRLRHTKVCTAAVNALRTSSAKLTKALSEGPSETEAEPPKRSTDFSSHLATFFNSSEGTNTPSFSSPSFTSFTASCQIPLTAANGCFPAEPSAMAAVMTSGSSVCGAKGQGRHSCGA